MVRRAGLTPALRDAVRKAVGTIRARLMRLTAAFREFRSGSGEPKFGMSEWRREKIHPCRIFEPHHWAVTAGQPNLTPEFTISS